MKSLSELEDHLLRHKHLPEIPSAKEFRNEGVDLLELNFKLLKKVEELTLYAIEQEKRIKNLESVIENGK